MTYLDAIRLILRTIDYHNRMSLEDPTNKEFHMKQSERLREWMVEMKEFIKENE